MPKEFYTEKDIEDLVKRGVLSLEVNENVVLTELAYEKANRLGMKLVTSRPDNPPAAPVRPYISQPPVTRPAAVAPSAASAPALPAPASDGESDLSRRIRSAVIAKLGTQVDPALLDVIIQRVLKSTGVK
jgi:hypothetical protein